MQCTEGVTIYAILLLIIKNVFHCKLKFCELCSETDDSISDFLKWLIFIKDFCVSISGTWNFWIAAVFFIFGNIQLYLTTLFILYFLRALYAAMIDHIEYSLINWKIFHHKSDLGLFQKQSLFKAWKACPCHTIL